ncbi:MucBP domain-containing protein, partial [Lactococcus petauri]
MKERLKNRFRERKEQIRLLGFLILLVVSVSFLGLAIPKIMAGDTVVSDIVLEAETENKSIVLTVKDSNQEDTKIVVPLPEGITYQSNSNPSIGVTQDIVNNQLVIDWVEGEEKQVTLQLEAKEEGGYDFTARTVREDAPITSAICSIIIKNENREVNEETGLSGMETFPTDSLLLETEEATNDNVLIPDPALRQLINKTLRKPSDYEPTASDLLSITTLDLSLGQGTIYDWTGLEQLTRLRKITDSGKPSQLSSDTNYAGMVSKMNQLPGMEAIDIGQSLNIDLSVFANYNPISKIVEIIFPFNSRDLRFLENLLPNSNINRIVFLYSATQQPPSNPDVIYRNNIGFVSMTHPLLPAGYSWVINNLPTSWEYKDSKLAYNGTLEKSLKLSYTLKPSGPFETKLKFSTSRFYTEDYYREQMYVSAQSQIITHYVDQSGRALSQSETQQAEIGKDYTTKRKVIEGYEVKEVQGQEIGKFLANDRTVTYVYVRKPGANVTVRYRNTLGQNIANDGKDVILKGYIGDEFKTEQKDIPGYKFKKVEGPTTGKFTDQPQTITYTYTSDILRFYDVPSELSFNETKISSHTETISRQDPNWKIIVEDTRLSKRNWRVTAQLVDQFKDSSGQP